MVAGVASLHMTTKRGGSALLDMAHDPPLMGGQMPLRLIARAIETDDVCHLGRSEVEVILTKCCMEELEALGG